MLKSKVLYPSIPERSYQGQSKLQGGPLVEGWLFPNSLQWVLATMWCMNRSSSN